MRILFIGGFYRGHLLAERLIERGENVVGAFVFKEDAHETDKYCDSITSLFAEHNIWAEPTRRISTAHLPLIRDELAPDVIFCLGWRTLIPTQVLECAPLGGIAVHDSLLPQLRGFAPTNWGLILGHRQLGATLFQLTDSVDAGDVFFQQAITPGEHESYQAIQARIAQVSVDLFDSYLDAMRSGAAVGRSQDATRATYTCARGPADGEINWSASSVEIERFVRALGAPAPGAFTYHKGSALTIDEARHVASPPTYEGRIVGRVIERNTARGTVDVLCGEGIVRISRVRTSEGQTLPATAVLKSVRESLGLNPTEEILQLRTRLEHLEARLAQLEAPRPISKAG